MSTGLQVPGIHIINVDLNPNGDADTTFDSAIGESQSDESLVEDGERQFFRYQHGRRWNKTGSYPLPTDKIEAQRLENQHRLCYNILNKKLFLSEIQIPERAKILDLGTSSGIWAIEMAEKYPAATVIGLDISPQQTHQVIPPNCSFVLHDLCEPLPFDANTFNFVHIRDMQWAITIPWVDLIQEIHRILVPNGVVQFAEFFYEHHSLSQARKQVFWRSPVKQIERWHNSGAKDRGCIFFRNFTIVNLLKDAKGWTDPQETVISIPIGRWPKPGTNQNELGGQMLSNMLESLNSFGVEVLEQSGHRRNEAQQLVTEAANQYKDLSWRMSINIMYCAVQKFAG